MFDNPEEYEESERVGSSVWLTEDGLLYTCGDGGPGESRAGREEDIDTDIALPIDFDYDENGYIINVWATGNYRLFITDKGKMYTFGTQSIKYDTMELGHRAYKDIQVPKKPPIVSTFHDEDFIKAT